MVRRAHLDRVNNELALLGMRGVTIITTAGDLGSSDGTPICSSDEPDFPSSSPYTTSLGATYLFTSNSTQICQSQTVVGMPIICEAMQEYPCASDQGSGFTTGGGFSAYFTTPSYQTAAVNAYLSSATLPPSSYFNSSCRGYNDVAAFGSFKSLIKLRKTNDQYDHRLQYFNSAGREHFDFGWHERLGSHLCGHRWFVERYSTQRKQSTIGISEPLALSSDFPHSLN